MILEILELNVKNYVRLVDDISIFCQHDFKKTRDLIEIMVDQYPGMPLNYQVSFGYSRFLDLHIYNMYTDQQETSYNMTHTLAYKEHSSFSYTPSFSNIHSKYKTAVIPISLFRIHTRCIRDEDINHHLSFMIRIVKNRNQDPKLVQEKIENFFSKKRSGKPRKPKQLLKLKTTSVTYDNISKSHIFLKRIISNSFGSKLRLVYKSRPKLLSLICPKRKVIRQLTRNPLFLEN